MRPAETIDKLIKKLHLTASDELDERIHSEVSKALAESKKTKSAKLEPNIWRIIMKSRITKFAGLAAIIFITILGTTLLDNLTTSTYGMSEALELIRQAKTLHIEGWYFGTYHSDTFDTEVSGKLPFEHWYDFENGRYRIDSTYFDFDGKLSRDSTICDGEYEMSETRYQLTTGERWKSIKFRKVDKSKTEPGWLEFYGKLNNIEGSYKIDEETIDGVQFDVWKVEITRQTREGGDVTQYRVQTWISSTTGEIGRIKEWRKENDGPWLQTIEYSTLECDVVLSPDLFVTEPPDGYRLENTKETATISSGITDLSDIYDRAEWDYAPLTYWVKPIFRLNNGSFLACWQSVDASESRNQAKYFQNLKIGGDLPQLPAEVYAFSPGPNVRNMQFVGYHLAYTRKETEKEPRWYEWSLYVPDKDPPFPSAVLNYHIHYRDNTSENKMIDILQTGFSDWQEVETEHDFNTWVLGAMAERSDDGVIPEHVTYEKVLRLSEELRDSLTQK